MTHNELLLGWLNDAYAMETAQLTVLTHHVKDAAEDGPLQTKLQQHLDATHRHADLVRECIESCGGSVSHLKSVVGKLTGAIHAVATGGSRDELMKNLLLDYSSEYFEIGCYSALIEAALRANKGDLVPRLEEILEEEEDMAAWVEDQIPRLVEACMEQTAIV